MNKLNLLFFASPFFSTIIMAFFCLAAPLTANAAEINCKGDIVSGPLECEKEPAQGDIINLTLQKAKQRALTCSIVMEVVVVTDTEIKVKILSANGDCTGYEITDFLIINKKIIVILTSVELVSFTASPSTEGISLNWKTALERNNAGFHLFKAKIADVSQVTPQLIPAKGTQPDGTEYSYVDKNLSSGIYVYVLVDIDTNGKTTYHLNNLQLSLPK